MRHPQSILDRFPKTRTALPLEYREIYVKHYQENRGGATPASSLSQKMERWLHTKVAQDKRDDETETLEIGAGNLNHLKYEPETINYDVVEPFEELYKNSASLGRVRSIYADMADVPATKRYDRITSIATFEHICNLPEVVARAGLRLKSGGALRTSIPSEGTFLWALGWKLTTGMEFRLRYGLDYGRLMAYEHVNTASEIESVLRFFFRDIKASAFGLGRRISLYQFFECQNPDISRCEKFLAGLEKTD